MLFIWLLPGGKLLGHSESFDNPECCASHPQIAVVGIGNILLSDDGVGVHLVHILAGKINSSVITVIDAGTVPELFLLADGRIRKLIFVDAVRGGGTPGSIYRFNLDELEVLSELPVSLHDLTLVDNLRLLELLGKRPESVVVIGVEPGTIEFGTQLSSAVEQALPKAIEMVLKEIEEFSKQCTEVK